MMTLEDMCTCGHNRGGHLYHEGICRSGVVCETDCQAFTLDEDIVTIEWADTEDVKVRVTVDQDFTPEGLDELVLNLKHAADQATYKQVDAYKPGDIVRSKNGRRYELDSRGANRFGKIGPPIVQYRCTLLDRTKEDGLALPCILNHGDIEGRA